MDPRTINQILVIAIILVLFYVLLIRPQTRREKERRQLISELKVGDKIVTIGGIHGTIKKLEGETVSVEISKGVTVTVAKKAIAQRVKDKSKKQEI